MANKLELYMQDLVNIILEEIHEIIQNNSSADDLDDGSIYNAGKMFAYVEILSLMQSQADSFSISRESLGLSKFDPVEKLADFHKKKPS